MEMEMEMEMEMRRLQVSLNQTQKIRLQNALQNLQSLFPKINSNASVTVADTIPVNSEDSILSGHGTAERDGQVVATRCGVVERVDKFVYVRPLRSRYNKPETGHIIVGRVVEVAPKCWKLEINFSQHAVLMLGSMNLPDGIQRRRTAVDELNMRGTFEENDVICAEVGNSQNDGSLRLQIRSQQHGKLEKGQLLIISPYLVKGQAQHFHHLEKYSVDLILGRNGFIWVGEHVEVEDIMLDDQGSVGTVVNLEEQEEKCTSLETIDNIGRIANAVRVLSTLGFTITVEVITGVLELSKMINFDVHEMLGPEFHVLVAEKEAERRQKVRFEYR